MYSKASIFKMVENAYQITLVMAFVPLVAGLFWKRSTNQGALVSIFCGLSVWLSILRYGEDDPFFPAQFVGVIASAIGMVIGSLLPSIVDKPLPQEPEHAGLHHLAASHTEHVVDHPHHHPSHHREH
jgi:Na+/proline symporter